MGRVPEGLQRLTDDVLGEQLFEAGASFNLHYKTASSFVKVTRPWVKPERFRTEVATALALLPAGVPTARPLVPQPLSFVDEEGKTRWATYWEKLIPTPPLTSDAGTRAAAEWIQRLWTLTPPPRASMFQLEDFLHAVHVRLDGSPSPLAPRIIAAVEEVVAGLASLPPVPYGFIHGDLHNENLLSTTRGLMVVDWESACLGPIEWDVAQNLRYASKALRPKQESWWERQGVSMPTVRFYRHVRSLSSLSHLVASDLKPPIYYRCLEDLGWA